MRDQLFGRSRKVLVPVGFAELHEKEDDVYLPGIKIEQFAAAPDYDKENLTMEHEIAVRNAFNGQFTNPEVYDEQTFYEHDHYNEHNLYGRRFIDGDEK